MVTFANAPQPRSPNPFRWSVAPTCEGSNGRAVVQAALVSTPGLNREHAACIFTHCAGPCSGLWRRWSWSGRPFAQRIFKRGLHEGELKGKRDTLL
jgi:hypothetical protein